MTFADAEQTEIRVNNSARTRRADKKTLKHQRAIFMREIAFRYTLIEAALSSDSFPHHRSRSFRFSLQSLIGSRRAQSRQRYHSWPQNNVIVFQKLICSIKSKERNHKNHHFSHPVIAFGVRNVYSKGCDWMLDRNFRLAW